MPKKLTPQEQHVRGLILKLIEVHKELKAIPWRVGNPQPQQEMADGIGVPRETLNRWLNWQITPRGLSVAAIERYLDKMEEK